MECADVFDLAVWDQFQSKGYQRRVKMRDSWVTVPSWAGTGAVGAVIRDVRTDPQKYRQVLTDAVIGKYRGAKRWRDRGVLVLDWIARCESHWLWENNLSLIMDVREFLGIRTPLGVGAPLPKGTDGLNHLAAQYGADVYLSGTGGKAYMDMDALRVQTVFSRHAPVTGDSILTVLFDWDSPIGVVTRTYGGAS